MASHHPFLNVIIEHALIILNHNQFEHHVLDELCAQLTKTCTKEFNELQQVFQQRCAQLKIEVYVDKLDILMS